MSESTQSRKSGGVISKVVKALGFGERLQRRNDEMDRLTQKKNGQKGYLF